MKQLLAMQFSTTGPKVKKWLDKYPTTVPIIMTRIDKYPTTERVDYAASFIGKDAATRIFLGKLTRLRNAMLFKMATGAADEVNAAALEYIKNLRALMDAMHSEVKTEGVLFFVWTSAMETNAAVQYKAYSYHFEWLMALLVYCYSCMNMAAVRYTTYNGGKHDEVRDPLLTAAYYLNEMAAVHLPKWTTRPRQLPVDIDENMLRAYSQKCLAMAHAPLVRTGLINNTAPTAIQKLARTVHLLLDKGINLMDKAADAARTNTTDHFYAYHLQERIFCAAVYIAAARVNWTNSKYGVGYAQANAAKTIMEKVCERIVGIKSVECSVHIAAVEVFSKECSDIALSCLTDINNVYYSHDIPEIAPVPEGIEQMYTIEKTEDTVKIKFPDAEKLFL